MGRIPVDLSDIYDRSVLDPSTGCLLWTRARNAKGYGSVGFMGSVQLAHRVAWHLANGPIPARLCVLHRCDTPRCVNVDHLFLGTHNDNMQDRQRKGRSRAPYGEAHAKAILTSSQVADIRSRDLSKRGSKLQLARELGVSKYTIWDVLNGRTWKRETHPSLAG